MKSKISLFILGLIALFANTSCSDSVSYADQLRSERKATNAYLARFRVVNEIPADTVFETGEDAPYYRLDEDGNVYMQVLTAAPKTDRPEDDQRVYFRFMRVNLNTWYTSGSASSVEGNAGDILNGDTSASPNATYFMYNNYTLSSSSQYGYGVQLPMAFVGIGSKVNLIVKSQYGFTDEISNVVAYRYTITYYKSQI